MFVLERDQPSTAPIEPQDIYGPLCTTIDTLGRGVKLPRLHEGDVLAVHCSGAYGPSSSPSGFISHPRAQEFMVTAQGSERAVLNCSVD
jgi:diaminopimelate decarboxylase